MTTREFSNAFDALLNSYSSQANFGDSSSRIDINLDEYEKSLFLTQAQEQLVIEFYAGRTEKVAAFEGTEELRSNLKGLIKTATLSQSDGDYNGVSKYSKFFVLPPDVLFITYEAATLDDESAGCKNGSKLIVTPVTQDEFNRVMNNPFRQTNKRKALRLDNGLDVVEIVTKYNIKDYVVRYLSKPTPIVLENFDGVSIDGVSTITECKLNSAMHRQILERAVALAIASRSIRSKNNV